MAGVCAKPRAGGKGRKLRAWNDVRRACRNGPFCGKMVDSLARTPGDRSGIADIALDPVGPEVWPSEELLVSVRIRMKKMGRSHQAFFRICAIDKRAPRGGRVLEELGTYDPRVPDTDARAILNKERVDYWLGVGAQPSENVAVLIKKYGTNGTH